MFAQKHLILTHSTDISRTFLCVRTSDAEMNGWILCSPEMLCQVEGQKNHGPAPQLVQRWKDEEGAGQCRVQHGLCEGAAFLPVQPCGPSYQHVLVTFRATTELLTLAWSSLSFFFFLVEIHI